MMRLDLCDPHRITMSHSSSIVASSYVKEVPMRKVNYVKKFGDFLYRNGLMVIALGLYLGIYAANWDELNV